MLQKWAAGILALRATRDGCGAGARAKEEGRGVAAGGAVSLMQTTAGGWGRAEVLRGEQQGELRRTMAKALG